MLSTKILPSLLPGGCETHIELFELVLVQGVDLREVRDKLQVGQRFRVLALDAPLREHLPHSNHESQLDGTRPVGSKQVGKRLLQRTNAKGQLKVDWALLNLFNHAVHRPGSEAGAFGDPRQGLQSRQ